MSRLSSHRLGLWRVHELDGRRTVDRCRAGGSPLVVHGALAMPSSAPATTPAGRRVPVELVVRTSLALGRDHGPLGVLGARCALSAPVRRKNAPLGHDGIALLPEVHHTEALLAGAGPKPIHILDGAGDDDALLAELHGRSLRYVVRLPNAAHLVQTPSYLAAFVSTRPHIVLRRVQTMGSATDGRSRKSRAARDAVLAVWAAPIELPSDGSVVRIRRTRSSVNLVTVVELHRSPVGLPICWHLATSEPTQTAEEVVAVVDAYRSHRLLHDLFQALREGCRIEERSMATSSAVDDTLGIFLPLAFRLLALRVLPKDEPCRVLTSRQISVLSRGISYRLPARPTNGEVCRALAQFRGAPPPVDVPSWSCLGHALERLFVEELEWIARESAPFPIQGRFTRPM